ncbi:MAG: flagellar protein FliT [Methylobacter sp.]|uniref:flagellar protein FliT n=1 Tax=Methylobacter sp. TaxID=2051955 RepID=UPI0025DEDF02|nr:flagellar protein FliT [Methylobacter sp.]MCK9621163.1 flagellar protein FliT [Methylobacter sp.]
MNAVPELVQQLEGFVELIASAVESKDWEDLNELLANRQEVLERLRASSPSPLERQAIGDMIASMQATDSQFVALVQSQKELLQKQAASLAHDRKAIQAYQTE